MSIYVGGIDLANQMYKFYTCTHKSLHQWYLQLFGLVDLAIDNAYISECCIWNKTQGQSRHKNELKAKVRWAVILFIVLGRGRMCGCGKGYSSTKR